MPSQVPPDPPHAQLPHRHPTDDGQRTPGVAPVQTAPGQHHGHGASTLADPSMARAMEVDLRRRFLVALAFTIPTVLIAGHLPGVGMPLMPPRANWLGLALSTPVVFWSGWMFLQGSVSSLRRRQLDMSVLIATGVLAAYMGSLYLTLAGEPTAFYEAAAMLVTFVLFGHWMELRARRGTSDALRALLALVPPMARVLREGREAVVPTVEVVGGDRLRVLPGEKIPVDGRVEDGTTDVDEALVTGESRPIRKGPGAEVVGGSINVSGAIIMRTTRVGAATVLGQIAALVAAAQASKAPGQRLADRAAAVLVVVAIGAGLLTFLGWTFLAGAPFLTALTFAISAIVIACPDALGLATPTAVAVGTGLGARHQILIKDAATLEGVSRLQVVVLDKTGTITAGQPTVTDLVPVSGTTEADLLRLAGSLAAGSTHPLSRAIVATITGRGGTAPAPAAGLESVAGRGMLGRVDGRPAALGNAALLTGIGVDTRAVAEARDRLAEAGRSVVHVAHGVRLLGLIGITDPIRATSREAIAELRRMGIRPVLLSGDLAPTARRVAAEVGIEEVYAEVRPEEKAEYVRKVQRHGAFTAMVGDGVNDAPALAQADVGVAIGSGTDVAIQAAQVVLMRSDPRDVARAIRLSRATVRKMKQNLGWASVYNLLAIPVAAGVFYPSLGWSLRPEVSALLMSLSSIIVALNALALRWTHI